MLFNLHILFFKLFKNCYKRLKIKKSTNSTHLDSKTTQYDDLLYYQVGIWRRNCQTHWISNFHNWKYLYSLSPHHEKGRTEMSSFRPPQHVHHLYLALLPPIFSLPCSLHHVTLYPPVHLCTHTNTHSSVVQSASRSSRRPEFSPGPRSDSL